MKEGKPLAKDLCFVVRLDPQSLSCVERPETFLQFAQDNLVHGISSSEMVRDSMGTSVSTRHYKVFPSGKQVLLPDSMADLHTRNSPRGRNEPCSANSSGEIEPPQSRHARHACPGAPDTIRTCDLCV